MNEKPTRIDTLELKNYRRFESLAVDLDPELTVLVAANGAGKTAILDALASAWTMFFRGLGADARAARFSKTDIRRILGPEHTMESALPSTITLSGVVAGQVSRWQLALRSADAKARVVHTSRTRMHLLGMVLQGRTLTYAAGTTKLAPTLPLLCYFGTGRLWSTRAPSQAEKDKPADTSRMSGYTDCLAPTSSFQFFESWFRRFSYEEQSEINSKRPSPHKPRERLAAVRRAVGHLLAPTGWQQLEWDFAEDALVASHAEHGRLPVRLLSDGIRNMIGLVGDIAHRAVRLNPHFGADAPRKTPGIVLIDEVDMHLHPGWQQTVVGSLREAFPGVQLIVTTHSHLVVSTVPGRCVRILAADGSISTPSVEIEGYDSPFTLAVVFGVNSSPPVEVARQLARYRRLIEDGLGDSEQARAMRDPLIRHFGAAHPAILEVDGMRRIQQMKARVAATRGGA